MTSASARVRAAVARLGDADAGELLTLQLAAWVAEAHENATLAIPPLHDSLADVRAQLADPAWTIWGLREHGRLVATVRSRTVCPGVGYVGRLGVVPDLQGLGLGSAMLAFVASGLPPDVHTVEPFTGLLSVCNHRFYARHGYVLVERDETRGIAVFRKQR